MTKQQLIDRKNAYELKRQELLNMDFEAEIEAELAKERAKLEEKYEAQRQTDVEKVDHYIELLNELVIDAAKEEAFKLAQEVEESMMDSVEK